MKDSNPAAAAVASWSDGGTTFDGIFLRHWGTFATDNTDGYAYSRIHTA